MVCASRHRRGGDDDDSDTVAIKMTQTIKSTNIYSDYDDDNDDYDDSAILNMYPRRLSDVLDILRKTSPTTRTRKRWQRHLVAVFDAFLVK